MQEYLEVIKEFFRPEALIGALTVGYITYNVCIAGFLEDAQTENNIKINFLSNLKKAFFHPKKTLDEIVELNNRLIEKEKSLNYYNNINNY